MHNDTPDYGDAVARAEDEAALDENVPANRWRKGMASPNPRGRPPVCKTVKDVKNLARTYTTAAVETLAKVMQNPKSPPACRVAASEALLGRAWGKIPTTEFEGGEQLVIKVIRMAEHIEQENQLKVIEHNGDDSTAE